MKFFVALIFTWCAFGIVTGYGVNAVSEGNEETIFLVNIVMPFITVLTAYLLLQLKEFLQFFYQVFTFFFRMFRRTKEKEDDGTTESDLLSYGRKIIILTTFLYSIAGWLLGRTNDESYLIWVYLLIGFCWGCILYFGIKKGN